MTVLVSCYTVLRNMLWFIMQFDASVQVSQVHHPCSSRNWSADKGTWGWSRDPPVSQKQGGDPNSPKKMRRKVSQCSNPAVLVQRTI